MSDKICRSCGVMFPIINYDIRLTTSGGPKYRPNCKGCRKLENQIAYKKRKEKKEEQRIDGIAYELGVRFNTKTQTYTNEQFDEHYELIGGEFHEIFNCIIESEEQKKYLYDYFIPLNINILYH